MFEGEEDKKKDTVVDSLAGEFNTLILINGMLTVILLNHLCQNSWLIIAPCKKKVEYKGS